MLQYSSYFVIFVLVNSICWVLGFAASDSVCEGDKEKSWSYNNNLKNGPDHWGDDYPKCYGSEQSPINIDTDSVKIDNNLSELQLKNYDKPITQARVTNNGHTVQVTPTDGVKRTLKIKGTSYQLSQFHFHWGCKKNDGTEHTIDDKQYAMELHLVHTDANDNIAVIGVLYKQGSKNRGLKPIVDILDDVRYEDESTDINSEIDLDELFDDECSYFRYTGSLTTPDCSEGVIWTVCHDVLTIGERQLQKFRKVYSVKESESDKSNCKLVNNVRPTQALNGRTVKSTT